MAKTFTVYDVTNTLPITINQLSGGMIRFIQDYQFKDDLGNVIESLGTRTTTIDVAFSALPQSIQDALVAIRNHLYNQAKTNEGL